MSYENGAGVLRRPAGVYRYWKSSPTPIILPETIIIIGLIALIFGKHAAASFAGLSNDILVRAMGSVMLIGGLFISISFIHRSALIETIGLGLAALGTALYSTSVFIALGQQGLITGVGFTGMSLVFLSRIFFIVQADKAHQKIDNAE